jgi:hypothetical protein
MRRMELVGHLYDIVKNPTAGRVYGIDGVYPALLASMGGDKNDKG